MEFLDYFGIISLFQTRKVNFNCCSLEIKTFFFFFYDFILIDFVIITVFNG